MYIFQDEKCRLIRNLSLSMENMNKMISWDISHVFISPTFRSEF